MVPAAPTAHFPQQIDVHQLNPLPLSYSVYDKLKSLLLPLIRSVPRSTETLYRLNELMDLVIDIQKSVCRDHTPNKILKIIADAQKKALQVDKHLAYHLNLNYQIDTVYTDLLNMALSVYSQEGSFSTCAVTLSAPDAASSPSVAFGASPPEAPTSAERSMGTCREDDQAAGLSEGERVQPEHMQLILSVSRKLISLKSDLNGEENRDRVREVLGMLVDCNISPCNKIIKIIVAVLKKAPQVEEQLPPHLQPKMREAHDILLDVILLLVESHQQASFTNLPSDCSSSIGSSDSVADSANCHDKKKKSCQDQ